MLAAARVIVSRTGGHGAVRELADRVLRDRRQLDSTHEPHSVASPNEGHES